MEIILEAFINRNSRLIEPARRVRMEKVSYDREYVFLYMAI